MGRRTKKSPKGHQEASSQPPAAVGDSNIPAAAPELPKASLKELAELIKNLLEVCSKPPEVGSKEGEDYPEIYDLVSKIQKIESVLAPPEHNRQEKFPAFITWLNDNGVSTANVEIADCSSYGYGLKATKDLKEGETLLQIPRKLMMTVDSAKESALGPLIAEDKILQVMPNVTLALHLLNERFSKASFWKPYIDVLPWQYSTPLYWNPDDLKLLKGSPVQGDATSQFRNIARQYGYFYRVLQKNPLAQNLPLKDWFTYNNYRWAVSAVMTRQNQLPAKDGSRSTLGMIPLWDMCNHINGVYTTDYNPAADACECFCLKDFSIGDQIFFFYGPRSNGEFLVNNGFVYPENEHDRLCIKLGISKEDPLYSLKSGLLGNLNIALTRSFYIHRGKFPVDGDLLAFLRVFSMDEETLKEKFANKEEDRVTLEALRLEEQVVSEDNERKAWTFLRTRATLLIKTYPQSSEEDESLLQKDDVGFARMAAELRQAERHILSGVVDYADQKLTGLISSS